MSENRRGFGRRAAWTGLVAAGLALVVTGIALSAPVNSHRLSNRAAAYTTNRTAVYPPATTAPSDATLPTITGSPIVGQTLSTSTGAWGGTAPITYAYQWQSCKAVCANITGATSNTVRLVAAELGQRIQVVVRASNVAGAVNATSGQTAPVEPNAQEVRRALSGFFSPTGKGSTIAKLLSNGGFTFTFDVPAAGTLVVDWYYLPKGAHIARAAKPVLVASARKSFTKSGKSKVKVKLTSKGRKLLKHAKHAKLTIRASFTPKGQSKTTRTSTHTFRK